MNIFTYNNMNVTNIVLLILSIALTIEIYFNYIKKPDYIVFFKDDKGRLGNYDCISFKKEVTTKNLADELLKNLRKETNFGKDYKDVKYLVITNLVKK